MRALPSLSYHSTVCSRGRGIVECARKFHPASCSVGALPGLLCFCPLFKSQTLRFGRIVSVLPQRVPCYAATGCLRPGLPTSFRKGGEAPSPLRWKQRSLGAARLRSASPSLAPPKTEPVRRLRPPSVTSSSELSMRPRGWAGRSPKIPPPAPGHPSGLWQSLGSEGPCFRPPPTTARPRRDGERRPLKRTSRRRYRSGRPRRSWSSPRTPRRYREWTSSPHSNWFCKKPELTLPLVVCVSRTCTVRWPSGLQLQHRMWPGNMRRVPLRSGPAAHHRGTESPEGDRPAR